jgi:RNA polymerase sigma factor for flagellar operon FliA
MLPAALVLDHDSLVRRIAHHFARRLPAHVELEDLIQAGMVGLLEAAQRYSGSEIAPCARLASFATFATHRIRGAMLDSLRDADWSPRSLRRRLRDIEGAHRRIQFTTCGAATPPAIAELLGVPLELYYRTLRDSNLARFDRLEEPQASDTGAHPAEPVDESLQPDEELEHRESIEALMAGIDALPSLERTVLELYYEQDYLMREIGVALELSESRVCQIHKRILERLKVATRRNLRRRLKPEEAGPRPGRFPALPARAGFG